MTVTAEEFLRRFLLHVLPPGFVRIRFFGFLANRRRKTLLPLCRTLLLMATPPDSHIHTASTTISLSSPTPARFARQTLRYTLEVGHFRWPTGGPQSRMAKRSFLYDRLLDMQMHQCTDLPLAPTANRHRGNGTLFKSHRLSSANPAASAANASAFLQTSLSKVIRPEDSLLSTFILQITPDRVLALLTINRSPGSHLRFSRQLYRRVKFRAARHGETTVGNPSATCGATHMSKAEHRDLSGLCYR